MSIAIGCDEAGFYLKEVIKEYLINIGESVVDYGAYNTDPVLYPEIAVTVAKAIIEGKHERGILICGTGIGMAIAANKVPGIRAAVCHDSFSTERARKSNNVQIMTLGARVIGSELAKNLISIWLKSEFQGGGSAEKVNRISQYEEEFLNSCK